MWRKNLHGRGCAYADLPSEKGGGGASEKCGHSAGARKSAHLS